MLLKSRVDGLIPNFKFYPASPDTYKARSSKNLDLPEEANQADLCRECAEFERIGRIGGRTSLREGGREIPVGLADV